MTIQVVTARLDVSLASRGSNLELFSNSSTFYMWTMVVVSSFCPNYDDLVRGSSILHAHFAQFGLMMHIGRGENKSKSEAMYFSSSFQEVPNASNTATFKVHDGFISFTDAFKYLGSIITPCLREDAEIAPRIHKATGQLASLVNVFRAKDIPLSVKHATHIALPLNTVLWGCKS